MVEMVDVVVVVIVVVVVVALAALGVPPPVVPEGGFSSSPSSAHAAPLRAPGSPSQTKGILVSISARPSTLPSWTSSVSVLPIRDPTDSWELWSRLELSRLEKSRVKLIYCTPFKPHATLTSISPLKPFLVRPPVDPELPCISLHLVSKGAVHLTNIGQGKEGAAEGLAVGAGRPEALGEVDKSRQKSPFSLSINPVEVFLS